MFRKAINEDVDDIMSIIKSTQLQFKNVGLNQWQSGYPNNKSIEEDLAKNCGYVLEVAGKIVGYCYCNVEDDPNYDSIDGGKWLNEDAYGVVHRFVIDNQKRNQGYAGQLLEECFQLLQDQGIENIRIDTHPNNKAMLKFIEKHGFQYCGEVQVSDGMRLAYQKII